MEIHVPIRWFRGIDSSLVQQFFELFSRFEYALKREGFLPETGDATPNWSLFQKSIVGRFTEVRDTDFVNAVLYLKQNPPRKQIVAAGTLEWKDVRQSGEADEYFVLDCVRRIRNNLFHGAKDDSISDPARDTELLRHGIAVLTGVLKIAPGLDYIFQKQE